MAYGPPINSVIEMTLVGSLAGQHVQNTIHLMPIEPEAGDYVDGGIILNDLISQIDEAATGWSFLQAVFSTDQLTMQYIQAQFIWPTRYAYTRMPVTNLTGTQPGDPAPPNVSAALTLQSDFTNPWSKSCLKIFGLEADQVADGFVSNLVKSHINSLGAWLRGPWTPTGETVELGPVIYRPSAPGASELVTHETTQETSRVMRRRTVGLGS